MIEKPLFLVKGNAKAINDKMMKNAGHFCFLKTEEVVLSSQKPNTYREAFSMYVTGLYCLYHDYGKKFLWYSLDQKGGRFPFCNDGKEDKTIEKSVQECKKHLKTINEVFRPNIVHGIFEDYQRNEYMEQLNAYGTNSKAVSLVWPQFVEQLPEKEWEMIVQRLIQEANECYIFLDKLAQMWEGATEKERKENIKRFAESNEFAKSIDIQLCNGVCRAEELEEKCITEDIDKLEKWRKLLAEDFQSGRADTPEKLYGGLRRMIIKDMGPLSSAEIGARYGLGVELPKII